MRSRLISAPPYPVEEALKRLGANLRTARLRRNLSLDDVAQKVGVSRFVVSAAEKGRPSTSAAVYVAILWALDLLDQFNEVGDPTRDREGMALSLARDRSHARRSEALDNDF